jgi:hypothetical protein
MSHTGQLIEHTVRVTAPDEATAVKVAEILARVAVALSAEDVEVATEVERFDRHVEHTDRDEDEVPA